MSASIAVALDLAARGIPVFPCIDAPGVKGVDKSPYIKAWQHNASTDPAQIEAWSREFPGPLWATPTGPASGYDVLDIDPRKGGDVWLKAHRDRLPKTRAHRTVRNNGYHLLFRTQPSLRISADKIAPGVDVRASGGYVIHWPAHGGEVVGADREPAPWPDWLLIQLMRAQTTASADGEVSEERRQPPSLDAVVELLTRMTNPADTTRDDWNAVGFAAAGCASLVDDPKDSIRAAWISWANRWGATSEKPNGLETEDMVAKWDKDLTKYAGKLAGWQTLERYALKLIPGYAEERQRQREADAETEFPPIEETEEERNERQAAEAAQAVETAKQAEPRLHRGVPMQSAQAFVERQYTIGNRRTLHRHNGAFYQWTGTHYRETQGEETEADLYRFLDGALHVTTETAVPFAPTRDRVGNVLAALRGVTLLPATTRIPAWLDGDGLPPAAEILPCANGLLHLPTRQLLPHTPAFFGVNALPYAYDPEAPPPAHWLAFLRGVWADDQQSIDTLQEMFGLLLTSDTRHHKVFLLVGPPRSGKGTIGRVLVEMLGGENCCNPTLSSLGQQFGMASLIGKPLATISDARLGRSTDPHTVTERLLSISGQDQQTIPRKYAADWTGYLPTRFVVMSNELPRLTDASGALASRFIILQMTRSFLGREDHGLTSRLLGELPGILNWSMDGLARLNKRGYFTQPTSAADAVAEMADLASPIKAFIRERCVIAAGQSVECGAMFKAWQQWCVGQNREAVGTLQSFGRDLRSAIPGVATGRVQAEGKRQRTFEGIGLLPEEDIPLHDL